MITREELWTQFTAELQNRGYSLIRKLSAERSSPIEGGRNTEVWLASKDQSQEVLKMSSDVLLGNVTAGNSPETLERLAQREAAIYQRIKHPNIPEFTNLFDVFVGDIFRFNVLATQYINAPNLQSYLDQNRILNEEQAKKILEDVLSALDYLHHQEPQILHRDIKPSNILFDADGDKAYLFDFNFSKSGEQTVSITLVANYGYYPMDTYSGQRQTSSQDLCALGNVVAALVSGKSIAGLREEQRIGPLDAIKTENLPLSPKMRAFLAKLTSGNMALRYQSAAQALQDLKSLDEIELEVITKRSFTITRDLKLEQLVEELRKVDPYFDYNVTPQILTTYGDEDLLAHLERTYSGEHIRIEDPRFIRNYIRPGDKVIKRKDFRDGIYLLEPRAEGKIVKVIDSESVIIQCLVEFRKPEVTVKFDLEDITSFQFTGRGWKSFDSPMNYGDFLAFGRRDYDRMSKDQLYKAKVMYTGSQREVISHDKKPEDLTFIPDGAKGIVFALYNDCAQVVWYEGSEQLKQSYSERYKNTIYFTRLDEFRFLLSGLILLARNRVNFEEMRKKYLG